jgi:hypothetical protein
MDPKEVVRRLAPELFQEIDAGWYPASGEVPNTSGRVVVRWVATTPRVELDRIPVWLVLPDGEGRWLSRRESLMLDRQEIAAAREASRAANRSRQAERDAARSAVIEAIRQGRPVVYHDGQEWGTLTAVAKTASARGVYRTLTGGSAGDEGWIAWLAEVTSPPAPVRTLPRRQRRDPVAFALAAEGV